MILIISTSAPNSLSKSDHCYQFGICLTTFTVLIYTYVYTPIWLCFFHISGIVSPHCLFNLFSVVNMSCKLFNVNKYDACNPLKYWIMYAFFNVPLCSVLWQANIYSFFQGHYFYETFPSLKFLLCFFLCCT